MSVDSLQSLAIIIACVAVIGLALTMGLLLLRLQKRVDCIEFRRQDSREVSR